MFSKSRINEPGPKAEVEKPKTPETPMMTKPSMDFTPFGAEGQGERIGAVVGPDGGGKPADHRATSRSRAPLKATSARICLTVGESATIRGEIVADDIVVNGRVIGRVRGLKVRLTSTARVEGDIIHKTIAIESGAHFEGSVQRQEDPLSSGRSPAGDRAP